MTGYPLHTDDPSADIVYELAEINFEGNILPISWFRHLRYKNGKPHLNAIMVLSDIVYWYRPIEVRDQYGHCIIEYRKKFESTKLQRHASYYERLFGLTKQQARDALNFLDKDGVITKEIVPKLRISRDQVLANVPFVEIVPERLREITRPIRSP